MGGFNLTVFATFLGQAAAAAAVAILLVSFYRHYGRRYLLYWSWSWFALGLYHLSAGLSLLERQAAGVSSTTVVLSFIAGVAGYLEMVWLLFGCYELTTRRPVKLKISLWLPVFFAVIGGALTLLFITTASERGMELRFFSRVGVRALFAVVIFAISGWWVWRSRRGRTKALGFVLVGATLFAYSLEYLHYFVIAASALFLSAPLQFSVYLNFLDFLLQGLLGLGMVTSLLEDEREAAVLATNEIEHLAYHDSLTGLPNRTLFVDRLIVAIAHAERHREGFAILFLDLDRFKDINDSLGHSVGDALLKSVAERIRRCVRTEDTVARFGGDEFTLLLPRIERAEDAAKVAQKVLETIRIPFEVGERELFVSTSIGISLFPADGANTETLIKNADSAMYRAKEYGRDTYQLYTPAMNARALERLALENMLRRAIREEEFVLFFQPLIDVKRMKIRAVEALIRWRHPELGLLLPAHFMPVAEASGLIVPMGHWCLLAACRQARAWQKKIAPIGVAVNLSARQFSEPDLVQVIRSVLDDTGLDPSQLELEITESNAMQNAQRTIHILRELKSIGVRISMDDFGTGYSSLSYLKQFPIDTLKLDQSFVGGIADDPNDGAIATAVISMAHSLRLKVVAEGVETESQFAFLKSQSCDQIQGFYFSRPLPLDELERFTAENNHLL
ncbi:MAG: EAL domain-containing protein [Thermoanaerobaculia bacterium]